MKREIQHMMIIGKKILWLLMCWLIFLSGCITDSYDYPTEEVEMKTITLSINMPENTSALSRAITPENEFRLDDVYLLLFNNGGYIDSYRGQNLQSGTGNDIDKKTCTVDLPPGTYDILIVGNCETILSAANLQEGQSRQSVATALKYELSGPWGYTDLTFDPFPIYGEVLGVVADSNKTLSNIPVIRMVARIDVKLKDASFANEHGKIRSVRLYNRNTQGQIIPNANHYTTQDNSLKVTAPSIPSTSSLTTEPLVYIPNVNPGTELTYTIYTPEAIKGTTNYLNNTCLVVGIGGKEDGGVASRAGIRDSTYYYRIDFMNEAGDDFIPLLRNHHYTITIDDIINVGFPDPDKAYRSEPYGLTYTILEWDTYKNDVEYDNPIYRLDVSETYLDMGSSGGDTFAIIQVTTTHPDGWSAYFSAYPDSIDLTGVIWMNNENLFAWDESDGYGNVGLPPEKTLNLDIMVGNPGAGTHTGYIHIVSGNMTNVITLKKTGAGGN